MMKGHNDGRRGSVLYSLKTRPVIPPPLSPTYTFLLFPHPQGVYIESCHIFWWRKNGFSDKDWISLSGGGYMQGSIHVQEKDPPLAPLAFYVLFASPPHLQL